MRDLFEQWVEAWSERIRSPVMGSLAIAFIVSNWKPLFFLLFAEAPVWLRIQYFEHHTDANSLVWYPLVAGAIAAFLIPWITLGGAWVARLPKFLLHRLQQDEGTRREIEGFRISAERESAKAEFEDQRARRKAQRENEIIAAGRRLKEAEEVSEETKETLKTEREILGGRERELIPDELKGNGLRSIVLRNIIETLGSADRKVRKEELLLSIARGQRSSGFDKQLTNQRREVEVLSALDWLENSDLVSRTQKSLVDQPTFTLTANGFEILDALRAREA